MEFFAIGGIDIDYRNADNDFFIGAFCIGNPQSCALGIYRSGRSTADRTVGSDIQPGRSKLLGEGIGSHTARNRIGDRKACDRPIGIALGDIIFITIDKK